MKKIVIASDSFKGSMSAKEVCSSIEKGILKILQNVQIIKIPMADGGEGTVETLVDATNGQIIDVEVLDPLGNKVNSYFGILGNKKTAVIEMALASGLPMVPDNLKNPLITTTYGTGQLIKAALDNGCREIIIGIGGSATNDGGVGMAQALGAKFLDKEGKEIGFGGGNLDKIESIDLKNLDERINKCDFKVACDVDNPLCGPKGAANIFGPQKGATPEMIKILDNNLAHFAKMIKLYLNKDVLNVPGAGAAGGLGAGLMALCNAKLQKGIDLVITSIKLAEKIKDADLVITGEGQMDFQTAYGKTPYGVAKVAKKYNIPVIAIVGSIGKGADTLYELGIDTIFSIVERPMNLDECIKDGNNLIEKTTERIFRLLNLFI